MKFVLSLKTSHAVLHLKACKAVNRRWWIMEKEKGKKHTEEERKKEFATIQTPFRFYEHFIKTLVFILETPTSKSYSE